MSDKKNLYLALAGAGTLVGAALLYHLFSSSGGESDFMEEVKALGPPKKTPQGLLQFDYYLALFKIVSRYSKERTQDTKKKLLE